MTESDFVDAGKRDLKYEEYLALKSKEKIVKESKRWEAAKKLGWPSKTVGITGV